MKTIELMRIGPVIPVLIIDDLADAVPIAQALIAGGIRLARPNVARAARELRPHL